jgi:hypothetical protein
MSLEERVHQVITGMARSQSSGSLVEDAAAHNNALARRLRRREHQELSINVTGSSTNHLDPIRVVAGRTSPLPNATSTYGRTSPSPNNQPTTTNAAAASSSFSSISSSRKVLSYPDPDVFSTVSSPDYPPVANKSSSSGLSSNIPRAPTTAGTSKSVIAAPTAATTTTRAPRALAKEKFKQHRRSASTDHAPFSHLSFHNSNTTSTTNTINNTSIHKESTTTSAGPHRNSTNKAPTHNSPGNNDNQTLSEPGRDNIPTSTSNVVKMNKLPPTSSGRSGGGPATTTIPTTSTANSSITAVPTTARALLRRSRSASPIKSSSSFLIKTQHSPKLMRKTSKTIDYRQRTFQKPQDQMKLYVATMDHSSRYIFFSSNNPQRQIPAPLAQLARKASTSVHASTALAQISPSLQLYTVQQYLSRHTHRRQLIWSPTVSPEADPFHGWDNHNDNPSSSSTEIEVEQQEEERPRGQFSFSQQQQQQLKKKRVGRYYPMHTSEYVNSKLPPHPPLLSVRKHRLPMRCDVGFPHCTEEEVQKKQKEIQQEASWEEACPRLAVLFSARDVGEFCQLRKILDTHGASAMAAQQKERKLVENSSARLTSDTVASISYFEDVIMASTTSDRKKPNPASVFAPPLESVPAGRGWKPRPVSDRPPGLRYVLVDPIKVTFDEAGDMEPLVCTLALYSAKGWVKISEDFSFPAGEWRNHLTVTDIINASAFDVEVNSPNSESVSSTVSPSASKSGEQGGSKLWRQKALMTFLASMNDGTAASLTGETAGHEDIYLVLTVFKVAHEGALIPYFPDSVAKKHSTPLKHLSRRFGNAKKNGPTDEIESCRSRAWAVFSHFGTQFLTPICFGAVPLFDCIDLEQEDGVPSGYRWPGEGCRQTIELFAFPTQAADSQDALGERLSFLHAQEVLPRASANKINNESSMPNISNFSDKSFNQPVPSISLTKSKGFMHRVGSKSTATEKSVEEGSSISSYLEIPARLHGHAIVSSAYLGADFTKVLHLSGTQLSTGDLPRTPFQISSKDESIGSEDMATRPMKLLVDVMGDFAVASRNRVPSKDSGSSFSKRSDRLHIVRLPRSQQSAGYTDAADIREVLFLPPTDYLPNYYSSSFLAHDLNLLFVYPKVLKFEDSMDNKENIKLHTGVNKMYTIQICLIKHGASQSNTLSFKMLDAIYNPAPGGKALLKSVYTKIPPNKIQMGKSKTAECVFFMQDEVKMRLPTVLDNSYCLNFSLFSVSLRADDGTHAQDTGLGSIEMIGSAQLPLLNVHNKEPASKVSVSTIISDKIHEVKLGSFLLLLETKVMSSLHISDPSVVTILRDFPIAQAGEYVQPQAYQIGNCPFSSIVDVSMSVDLIRHFDILMYIHFRNLIQTNRTNFDFNRIAGCFPEHGVIGILRLDSTAFCDSRSLLEALHSLLSTLDKVKSSFFPQSETCYPSSLHLQQYRMNIFFKRFFDVFEEEVLRREDAFLKNLFLEDDGEFSSDDYLENRISPNSLDKIDKKGGPEYPSGESVDEFNFEYILDLNSDSMEDNSVHPSIRKIGQRSRSKIDNDLRSLGQCTNSSRDMPFSRRAYGSSKIHRMRIEAELGEDSSLRHRSPENYFYDDATIITTATWHEPLSDRSEGYIKLQREEKSALDKEKVLKSIEPLNNESDNHYAPSSLHEQPAVKKNRSPYNIFFAPCVAPSYDSVVPIEEHTPENENLNLTGDHHAFLQPKKKLATLPSASEADNSKPVSVKMDTWFSALSIQIFSFANRFFLLNF